MSRFSKAEIPAGWEIVHEQPPIEEVRGGDLRTIPGNYRAEKRLANGQLINEQAETIGLLLEHINAKEAFLVSVTPVIEHAPSPSVQTLDEAGIPVRHVLTPAGAITEEELATRGKADVIHDEEGSHFIGATFDAAKADEDVAKIQRDLEDESKAQVIAPRDEDGNELEVEEEEDEHAKATGAAIEAAEALGINLEEVSGTGLHGKVTKPDVEAVASGAS